MPYESQHAAVRALTSVVSNSPKTLWPSTIIYSEATVDPYVLLFLHSLHRESITSMCICRNGYTGEVDESRCELFCSQTQHLKQSLICKRPCWGNELAETMKQKYWDREPALKIVAKGRNHTHTNNWQVQWAQHHEEAITARYGLQTKEKNSILRESGKASWVFFLLPGSCAPIVMILLAPTCFYSHPTSPWNLLWFWAICRPPRRRE